MHAAFEILSAIFRFQLTCVRFQALMSIYFVLRRMV